MPWPKMFCGTACVALLCACASDDNREVRCHATQLESDLESQYVVGSAELQLEAGREYIVSSTYGVPKRGADGAYLSPRYEPLMGAIIETLQSQPGLLSLQLSSSESCRSGRTLAVWESEELMYEFVTSGPHLEAMSSAKELLEPGYAVTHWGARTRGAMTLMAAPGYLRGEFE